MMWSDSVLASTRFLKYGAPLAVMLLAHQPASAQTASLDGAIAAAKHWATLADAKSTDRMWSSSGPVMQKSFNKDDWGKYLTSLQTDFGGINKRDWVQVVRISNPESLPPGEYVNVVFASRFAKSMAIEKISLVQDGTSWVPVGYTVTKPEQVAAVAPAAVAGAPAAPAAK
ncbi:DUF4019 domain-containing protein [Herbaspirillum lusitanum]|uniref:DUF4019 domain-containing protein n=1 Tax=Herbaspirillum lusitanum TaxID=213312 RepID=A0ABW9ADT7_9BURK